MSAPSAHPPSATASSSSGPTSSAPPSVPPPVPHPVPAPPAAAPRPLAAVSNAPLIVPTTTRGDGIRVVPHAFELCQVDDLIVLISSMLDRLITHNDRIPLTPTSLTRFHSRAPPSITVVEYLSRIARYTNVEPAVLLVLLPYVDKVCSRWTTFTISSLSVHRFVIAGVSVGSKALSDSFCTNGRYARVGGISVAEMNLLEKEFCEAIDWRLTIKGAVLAHYYTSLVTQHPQYILSPAPPSPSPTTLLPSQLPSSPSSNPPRTSTPPLAPSPPTYPYSNSTPTDSAPMSQSTSPSSSSLSSSASPSSISARPYSHSASPNLNNLTSNSNTEVPRGRTAPRSPSLIPPKTLKTRLATASHLPSPVRPPNRGSVNGSGHGLGGLGKGSLDRMDGKLREVKNHQDRDRDWDREMRDVGSDDVGEEESGLNGMEVDMRGENGRSGVAVEHDGDEEMRGDEPV